MPIQEVQEVKMKRPKAVPPQVKFQAALEAIKGVKSLVVELARIYNENVFGLRPK